MIGVVDIPRAVHKARVACQHRVGAYLADHAGGCPVNLAAVLDYGKFEKEPRDAWGHPFRLVCPGSTEGLAYQLMSDGPDGKPGGLDRIE